MSILKSVKRDIENSLDDNARVGLALAADTHHRSSVIGGIQKHKPGEDWEGAYLAWSTASTWESNPSASLCSLLTRHFECRST
jgi:hypothetical protein